MLVNLITKFIVIFKKQVSEYDTKYKSLSAIVLYKDQAEL